MNHFPARIQTLFCFGSVQNGFREKSFCFYKYFRVKFRKKIYPKLIDFKTGSIQFYPLQALCGLIQYYCSGSTVQYVTLSRPDGRIFNPFLCLKRKKIYLIKWKIIICLKSVHLTGVQVIKVSSFDNLGS